MPRAKIIVRNSPVIKNSHLIGAGNKFPSIKDAQGNIQWRLSVAKQAEPQKALPSMDKMLERVLQSSAGLNKSIEKQVSFPNMSI